MKKFLFYILLFSGLVFQAHLTHALVDYQDSSIISDCSNGSTIINTDKKICVMIRLHEKAILQKDTKVDSCWGRYYITGPTSKDSEKRFELQLGFLSNKETICKPVYKEQDKMMEYISSIIDKIKAKAKISTGYVYLIKASMFSYKFGRDMNNELEKMIVNMSAFMGAGFDRATMTKKGAIWDMQKRYLSQMTVNFESNNELSSYDSSLRKLYSCYLTTPANKPSSKSNVNPKLPLLTCLEEFKKSVGYTFK